MAQVFMLTDKPVRVTSASDAQELRIAKEVLEFDELDLSLHVLSAEGTTPSLTLTIQTGMQIDSTSAWNDVASFAAKTASDTSELKNFTGFARYVRWKVTALTGSGGPAFTFAIQGVGRRWA
jgi:hypothetical protein